MRERAYERVSELVEAAASYCRLFEFCVLGLGRVSLIALSCNNLSASALLPVVTERNERERPSYSLSLGSAAVRAIRAGVCVCVCVHARVCE